MISKKSESRERNSAKAGYWLTLRRASQLLLLTLFLLLFLYSKYPTHGSFTIDLFFKIDPLVALLASLAARDWMRDLEWALPVLGLALILGRFFCGWVCPLGTTIDISRRFLRKKKLDPRPSRRGMWFKYTVLVFLTVSALLSVGFFWFFDPISLLLRSMTLFLYPVFASGVSSLLDTASLLPALEDPALDLLDWLRTFALPVHEPYFLKSLLVTLIFLSIIIAERYKSRFWCRYVCPLGALFGLFSSKSLLRRRVSEDCTECGKCQKGCRMAAIAADPVKTCNSECILCMDCSLICPENAISYGFRGRDGSDTVLDLPRRRLVFSGLAGLIGAGVMGIGVVERARADSAIRPPGAVPEGEFADRCIRCYACVRACSTSGGCLQPSLSESGIEALLTPVAAMRIGYCEYNCNLCGTVCPTGAIHELDMEDKKKRRMGLAYFDRNRCIPWASGDDCIVCEEHCPLPDKAIKFELREVHVVGRGLRTVKLPYVLRDVCIGCGICETRCPVRGRAAIVVSRDGEERWMGGTDGSSV